MAKRKLTQRQIKFLFAVGILRSKGKGKGVAFSKGKSKEIANNNQVNRFGTRGEGRMHRDVAKSKFPVGTRLKTGIKGKEIREFEVTGFGTKGLSTFSRDQGIVIPKLKQVAGKPDKGVRDLSGFGLDVRLNQSFSRGEKVIASIKRTKTKLAQKRR